MATIIKRESEFYPSGTRLSAMALDMNDMSGQADEYLEAVRAEALKIVEVARQEALAVRAQSELAGREAAEAAIERILEEKVAQQMKSLTPALAQASKQIEDSRQEWLQTWESRTVQLACAIARRIVRRELQHQPDLPTKWVAEALRMCAGSAEITLRLNPADHATLGGQAAKLAEEFHSAAPAKIVADESITPGGCRVETEFGSIDQQIETQLERIAEELS
jgi:flagellar biosynthesis/type III secretory pathway protein FliH